MMAVAWVNGQVLFDGLVQGLVIAFMGVGIVLVYRASRVINFAAGNMGLVGAATLSLITLQYGVPFWLAAIVAVLIGMVFGLVVDLAVVRRLRMSPRVIVLVATIGVAQLAQAIATWIPKPANAAAHFPAAINGNWKLGGVAIRGSDLAVLVVVPAVLGVLIWFLNRTTLGKTVSGSAANPDLARLSGISPKLVSTLVWTLAGALSTVGLLLVAGQSGSATSLVSIGPDTLLNALAAAVVGGMVSFRRTIIGGIAIGVGESLIDFNFLANPGLIYLVLFATIVIAVSFYSRDTKPETRVFSFTPKSRPLPRTLKSIWWIRHLDRIGLAALAAIGILLPLLATSPSNQQLLATIVAYAICASSLTVLTGWAGQLSLGQMAFAGIGALLGARLVIEGVPFWASVAIAAGAMALLAVVIGLGSLRVRGLMLAVTTFAFAILAQQYLYMLPLLSGDSPDGQNVPFVPGHLTGLSFSGQRAYYYAVLLVLALVVALLSWLRRTTFGRRVIAVRDNELTAAAYGAYPVRTKVGAFALAGALAGLGGGLLAGAYSNIAFTQNFFLVNDSLVLVALVVIGGLGSITGAIVGAVWIIGVPAISPNNQVLALLASSLGLLILLLYFPRGLNQVAFDIRDAVVRWAESRFGTQPIRPDTALARPRRLERSGSPLVARAADPGGQALSVCDISVQYGGNKAVDEVSLEVGAREIVGLIGSNGAGKSTLMNAIGGFVPCTGSVMLLGHEISSWSPSRRTRPGLGRTFQAATLFPELTVQETVLVALGKTMSERRRREEAIDLIDFLGLGRYADHRIEDLSTGTRRIVELSALLAMDAKVLCLDEPTAGVAQRETEAFGPLIVEICRELNASMLIIEHDMPLIMSVSDRVYCLEVGHVIAVGRPEAVRNDPLVIASYLGTDDRAIERSNTDSRRQLNELAPRS